MMYSALAKSILAAALLSLSVCLAENVTGPHDAVFETLKFQITAN